MIDLPDDPQELQDLKEYPRTVLQDGHPIPVMVLEQGSARPGGTRGQRTKLFDDYGELCRIMTESVQGFRAAELARHATCTLIPQSAVDASWFFPRGYKHLESAGRPIRSLPAFPGDPPQKELPRSVRVVPQEERRAGGGAVLVTKRSLATIRSEAERLLEDIAEKRHDLQHREKDGPEEREVPETEEQRGKRPRYSKNEKERLVREGFERFRTSEGRAPTIRELEEKIPISRSRIGETEAWKILGGDSQPKHIPRDKVETPLKRDSRQGRAGKPVDEPPPKPEIFLEEED